MNPWEQYNNSLANIGQTVTQMGNQDLQRQSQQRQNSLADLQLQQGQMEMSKAAANAPIEAKQREALSISLDDKLAEYGAKVAAGQGDINEYYKGKQKLDRMKRMGEAIKPYLNKPEALQSVWPQLVQAFPEFANIDPKVFKATPDGIMTPFKTPDGKEVPNMFYLYDNEGKMQIKEVKPEKAAPMTTRNMPIAGGMIQRMQFNPTTGKDEPYGVPFKPTAQQKIEIDRSKPAKMGISMNGLSPEQSDALSTAISEGRLAPYKINSRNQQILADTALKNPGIDLNGIDANLGLARNAKVQDKAGNAAILPDMIKDVAESGKKLNYSNNAVVGKVGQWWDKMSNDPDFINYAAKRNDIIMRIGGVMRENGMTDQAQKLEEDSAPRSMSPRAFDGWAAAQMAVLNPIMKKYTSQAQGEGTPGVRQRNQPPKGKGIKSKTDPLGIL